jgi:hypothetical protein
MLLAGVFVRLAAQSVMIDLGAVVAILTPEVEIQLPVTLNAPGEGPAQITMEIGYPAGALKFMSVQPGSTVDQA